jgi:molybdopterin molybdotransferase
MKHSPNNPILLTSSLHVDEACKAIAALVDELLQESAAINDPADIETVPLDQAINRVLAQDLLSPIDVHAVDNSAMDGYAFDGKCLNEIISEISLKIVSTALASKPYEGKIGTGECLKIMTSAVMPTDCDTVIPQELTASREDHAFNQIN